MPDYTTSTYIPSEGCQCCYGPDGCLITFDLICEEPGRGARPAYKLYFEGPSPCIGTYLMMDVPVVPAVVHSAGGPGCEGFACQADCPAPITEVVTFGPLFLPIGCCDCSFDICVRDVVPGPVIPDGCTPGFGYPTTNFGCGNDVLYMKKDGMTVKAWTIGYDIGSGGYTINDIDTFDYGVCLNIPMIDICNPAP